MGRITLNLGLRYDQFIGESRESDLLASRFSAGAARSASAPTARYDPGDLCTGEVQNWKDISPRVGFAMDVFGNGRTAVKASYARYVAGEAIAFANAGQPDRRADRVGHAPWTDLDGNGLPFDANGNIQLGELTTSASTPTFGKLTCRRRSTTRTLLHGWGKRGYNDEYTVRDAAPDRGSHVGERRLLPPHVRQPDVHRRPALRREQLRLRSASRRRPIRICRAAAATRSAACRT